MAMYSLGIIPLIMRMSEIPSTRQVWYADDSSVCSSIDSLLSWWQRLTEVGPSFGYFPIPSKTWLLVKDDFKQRTEELFRNSITRPNRNLMSSANTSGRRFNLIVAGLNEWAANTQRTIRLREDLEEISSILSPLLSSFNDHTIRDCFRLGRYSCNRSRPIFVVLVTWPPFSLISHLLQTVLTFRSHLTFHHTFESVVPFC